MIVCMEYGTVQWNHAPTLILVDYTQIISHNTFVSNTFVTKVLLTSEIDYDILLIEVHGITGKQKLHNTKNM